MDWMTDLQRAIDYVEAHLSVTFNCKPYNAALRDKRLWLRMLQS